MPAKKKIEELVEVPEDFEKSFGADEMTDEDSKDMEEVVKKAKATKTTAKATSASKTAKTATAKTAAQTTKTAAKTTKAAAAKTTRKTTARKTAEPKKKAIPLTPLPYDEQEDLKKSGASFIVDSEGEEDEMPAAEEAAYERETEPDTARGGEPDEGAEGGAEKPSDDRGDEKQENSQGKYEVTGILDIADGGFGFLRFDNFLTSNKDVYVSPTQIRRFNLKTGDEIFGIARKARPGERFGALLFVTSVNGDDPGTAIRRPRFETLTPIFPKERLTLETSRQELATRLIDIIAPIGKGQRGIIAAPPKAGKTTLLKSIANAIESKYKDIDLFALLIDERPEEVTDMKRSLLGGQVIYSTFDEQPEHHVKVAEMVLARAQRLAEHGHDVVIMLDSLTRLARAYNLVIPASGRTLSGGLDPAALFGPKRFFGAARNIEEGGSITILATALIDTGSRMDDMIFEEFKGTGNMELHLDREMQERRIFPAIDINKSGTRREELLMTKEELAAIWTMRREMSNRPPAEVTQEIVDNLSMTKCNKDFIEIIRKVFQ